MAHYRDISKSVKAKETKCSPQTAKTKWGRVNGHLPLGRTLKTNKLDGQLMLTGSKTGSNAHFSADKQSRVTFGKDVHAEKYQSGKYKFIASPKLTRKDAIDNEDGMLKRPASVALPHIATQRYLTSPELERDSARRSLPDITTAKQSVLIKDLNRRKADKEYLDFCSYPIDKAERENIKKNSKKSQINPVSFTYLMWLEENPQREVKLRNHGLGTGSVAVLKNALEHNNILEELDLAGNNLNDAGIEDLALFLRGHSCIKTLDLSTNAFSSKGITAIGNLPEATKTLTSLFLSRDNLSDTDLELLCSSLEDTDNKLKILDLSFNRFTPEAGFTLGRFIAVNSTIKELDIQGNSIGPLGSYEVFNGLRKSALRKLNIAANAISDEGMMLIGEIRELGKDLQHLDLSDNFITKSGMMHFLPKLGSNYVLNALKLDNNPIGTDGLIDILQCLLDERNNTLSQLYVKGVFADETVKELCWELRMRNKKFILAGTLGNYGSEGVDALKALEIYLRNNELLLSD